MCCIACLLLPACARQSAPRPASGAQLRSDSHEADRSSPKVAVRPFAVHVTAGVPPAEKARVTRYVTSGARRVTSFFGHRFPAPFDVRIFATRRALDAYWSDLGHLAGPRSECWMVASGVGAVLAVLSPSAWTTEACDHDPKDSPHVEHLIAHELVHVFHGQHNPVHDFAGFEPAAWFVEGVAVYVSGQLDEPSRPSIRVALREGRLPTALETAWSGPYRYQVCGSLVQFVDEQHGRALLFQMLQAGPGSLLGMLGRSEADFLQRWRSWLRP